MKQKEIQNGNQFQHHLQPNRPQKILDQSDSTNMTTICKHFKLGLINGFEPACVFCSNEALERVIAEQQATIDSLKKQVESGYKTLNTMWAKHNELFENFARLVDADIPKDDQLLKIDEYRRLRHACRLQMLDADYCMTCYNFVCECEGQYD